MRRLEDWPERLASVVEARLCEPFAWGTNDCCMFAADCVEAMTGVDLLTKLRGTYDDEFGAARALEAYGGIANACDVLLERIDPATAKRGDLMLFEIDGRATLTVCAGECACGPGKEGLAFLPSLSAEAAWKVA